MGGKSSVRRRPCGDSPPAYIRRHVSHTSATLLMENDAQFDRLASVPILAEEAWIEIPQPHDTTEVLPRGKPATTIIPSHTTSMPMKKASPVPKPKPRMQCRDMYLEEEEENDFSLTAMRKGVLLKRVSKNGVTSQRLFSISAHDTIFAMHTRGAIVEFPFDGILSIQRGVDFIGEGKISQRGDIGRGTRNYSSSKHLLKCALSSSSSTSSVPLPSRPYVCLFLGDPATSLAKRSTRTSGRKNAVLRFHFNSEKERDVFYLNMTACMKESNGRRGDDIIGGGGNESLATVWAKFWR